MTDDGYTELRAEYAAWLADFLPADYYDRYAEYRWGNWKAAVGAFQKLKELGSAGDSLEWFPLSMAYWRLGDRDAARKTYDQAVAALDVKGLKASRAPDQYNDDDSTAGKVVAASPSQGSTAKRGDTITVSVSKGRPEVPSLNGLTVDDAKAKLAAVGLTLGGTYGPGGGKVFLATPSAGTKVKPGSSVDVFIL